MAGQLRGGSPLEARTHDLPADQPGRMLVPHGLKGHVGEPARVAGARRGGPDLAQLLFGGLLGQHVLGDLQGAARDPQQAVVQPAADAGAEGPRVGADLPHDVQRLLRVQGPLAAQRGHLEQHGQVRRLEPRLAHEAVARGVRGRAPGHEVGKTCPHHWRRDAVIVELFHDVGGRQQQPVLPRQPGDEGVVRGPPARLARRR
mmetsp:Transcript_15759/g.41732  ORF Transcript_15759/g.41732 Transcript_15759/m.41732 type:complete len:202 (+) Transcript_15759:373-978(+)